MDQDFLKKKHLLARAGFGISLRELGQVKRYSLEDVLTYFFKQSEVIEPLRVTTELPIRSKGKVSESEKRERREASKKLLKELNAAWIKRMASTEAQLREKMTFFWHDHFACHLKHVHIAQKQNNTLRQHALGNFRDMLFAISQDPGVLLFLNNQQNRKQRPNENFARELLELFTLGRGNYTEQDIKEAARAFTGWGTDFNGNFVFRKRQHDFGVKSFMGKKGNFGGEDILQIVLDDPRTAYHITYKLYRFFVNENPQEAIIEKWANSFYNSGYDIGALMRSIFSSKHFYAQENIGKHIKSPVEYIVSLMRVLDMHVKGETTLYIQRGLGQVLFQPPNVAGWPLGKSWIDGSSLVSRLQIPKGLIWSTDLNVRPKASFAGNEDSFPVKDVPGKNRFQSTIDWQPFLKNAQQNSNDEMIDLLSNWMLNVPFRHMDHSEIIKSIRAQKPGIRIKQLVSRIICTPEFQMC